MGTDWFYYTMTAVSCKYHSYGGSGYEQALQHTKELCCKFTRAALY